MVRQPSGRGIWYNAWPFVIAFMGVTRNVSRSDLSSAFKKGYSSGLAD